MTRLFPRALKLAALLTAGLAARCFAAEEFSLPEPSSGTHRFNFEADRADYNRSDGSIRLRGNVSLNERERPGGLAQRKVRGEDFTVYPSSRVVLSPQKLLVEDGVNVIMGDSGEFDWTGRKAHLTNAEATYEPWRILRARDVTIDGSTSVFKGAEFTSCDEKKPHYRFKASTLKVIPGRRVTAFNAMLYMGSTPVFYFPYIYRPLGTENPYVTRVFPGFSDDLGFYIQTVTIYHPTPKLSTRLYLDYYAKRSVGVGTELTYNDPGNFIGTISGYNIKESHGGPDRWGLYGGYWLRLKGGLDTTGGVLYYTQGDMRLMSDPDFNNTYFKSNPYAVSPDQKVNAAVVRQGAYTTTRLSVSRTDTATADKKDFYRSAESKPRMDFSTAQLGAKYIPFLTSFSSYFDSTQVTGSTFYNQQAGGRATITRSIPLIRRVTLTPTLYYDESLLWPRNSDGSYNAPQYVGRYSAGGTLRVDNPLGTLDTTYTYVRRLSNGTFNVDRDAADRGEELNKVTMEQFWLPHPKVYARFGSGYDFHWQPGDTRVFYQRLQPIFGQVGVNPNDRMSLFGRVDYTSGEGIQAVLVQSTFGLPKSNNYTLGFTNYKSAPSSYYVTQTFGIYPKNATWAMDVTLGSLVRCQGFAFDDLRLFNRSFTFYKDFHDFKTLWTYRARTGSQEFAFNVMLKFNEYQTRPVSDRETEQFWRPWRTDPDSRD